MDIPIKLVINSAELKNCIDRLSSKAEIAFDLEFDKNYYRFGFNLCLIQIFDGETCYLIDPLSKKLNIIELFQVLENRFITKVCFSVDEDLRLLHSIGCFPANLYDTDIASRLLNYPAMSLTNLLMEILDVDPGESLQRSNWYNRPLTNKQINYAANDVLHLPELKKA
jgi:ribonuclease D